jgi:hypothetical protein
MPEEAHSNLGYPGPFNTWIMSVVIEHDQAGNSKTIPIAFSERQACEIAKRINAYYGETVCTV